MKKTMSDQKIWEDRCRRCGQCCFEKWIEAAGRIRFTRIPCRHLDMVSRECRVYDKRLDVGEGCVQLTPENLPQLHWLPADCAYVELLDGAPVNGNTGKKKACRKTKRRGERGR